MGDTPSPEDRALVYRCVECGAFDALRGAVTHNSDCLAWTAWTALDDLGRSMERREAAPAASFQALAELVDSMIVQEDPRG